MESELVRKRVLILSASVGSGHMSAAAALEQVFRDRPEVEVINQDALELTNDAYRAIQADIYTRLMKESPWLLGWWYDVNDQPFKNEGLLRKLFDLLNTQPLVKFIKRFDPHISVCTHFAPAGIIAQLMARQELNTSLSIVTTDYDFQGMWLSQAFTRYFVALEETRANLSALGLSMDRVTVSGIPVNPLLGETVDRAAVLASYGLRNDLPLLLISAGAIGGGPAREVVSQVMRLRHEFQAVVVCGKNTQLRREVEALAFPQAHRFRVLGFSTDLPNLMRVATLFIGKPGGLSSSECMAAGLPMLIIAPVPGQEERNSNHLLEEGAAMRCNDIATVAFKIDKLLADPGRLWQMRANARRLGRPEAARIIVETTLADQPAPVLIGREEQRRIIETAQGALHPARYQQGPEQSIALYDDQSGIFIGNVTEAQFRLIRRHVKRSDAQFATYPLHEGTIAVLRERGADRSLIAMLQRALAARGMINVRRVML